MTIELRNSAKALIIEGGRLLCLKHCAKDSGEVFYGLPGGGQEGGETFADALRRECVEELGAEVEVGELALIREYIGKNHEFARKHGDKHQIDFVFRCKLLTPVDLEKATNQDAEQVGAEWLPLAELASLPVYPRALRTALDAQGSVAGPLYLGDVN